MPLWFAFNLLSLTYWKQHHETALLDGGCCDLLSIYYLWHTENNSHLPDLLHKLVVICFQSIIFDILKTTHSSRVIAQCLLWFAFNLLSLTYWKQLVGRVKPRNICCDLLSIYYLWHTENNSWDSFTWRGVLWFAFNLLSLTYWKQRKILMDVYSISCDLLSIYYLWHTENNGEGEEKWDNLVVICFQSIIFDILKTTLTDYTIASVTLWFAFNLLSLTYWKQPQAGRLFTINSCDLLSIYYLWHTENNEAIKWGINFYVVICFQSIIFDILKTTTRCLIPII